MATTFIAKHSLTILALTHIFFFPWKADDYFPQTGAANGYVPQTGGANGYGPQTGANGYGPQTGSVGVDDPAEVVSKALLCFNNNYVYSSCEQSYRLTESGDINVPPEYADQYCRGPCFSETNLVLNCIDNILSHFLFYNRASIQDVRETIKAGCSYGPERGNFNVAEHIQARENSASKSSKSAMLGLLLMTVLMGYYLLY
ncbi:hypothetical protein DCAR_0726770 [Daucus carota subsp. sativus]|uniref:DUF7731 domain-containing protein n=1 Tax=Daucus carota subsp. sativus TaxID=79200 RepID=A0AAF1B5V7_DAUCS|nr:hypothetical protein DCAR_0726770 [Daucus carota subsp. sativus]